MTLSAQPSLAGHTYHNANIMEKAFDDMMKDLDQTVAKVRKEGIAKAEKKKGRKLTDKEIAKLDQEIKDQVDMANSVRKGMRTAITVEFRDKSNLTVRMDMKISDEVLKAAGVGWLKRKALKAALAVAPKEQKGTYVVKGNMVILTDTSNEKDTMTVSQDGKYLMGKLDEKTHFTLTKTK